MRTTGTQATGIRTPIIHEGDALKYIVLDSLLSYCKETGAVLRDNDIVGVTEAVVARAQGNYATVSQIAKDVRAKFPSGAVGVVFPILSRNRFSILLKGIAAGADKLYIQLRYPADEVGNHIIAPEELLDADVNPYMDAFTEAAFRERFNVSRHAFTDVDYMELYREIGHNAEIILSNNPKEILKYTKNVIAADIHTREQTKHMLASGAERLYGLDDILTSSVDGSGFNMEYGLLGSNKASEDKVKLFPRDCDAFVTELQAMILEKTGARVEVMVYGDGAFKDPVGKIWELADPVVSPAYTQGLSGLPNELKLKYLADNEFGDKRGSEAQEAMIGRIRAKNKNLMGKDESEGTTPRRLNDLIGSLCDLMSGSGDKGTPVILVKGYFDNYASE